MLGYFVNHGAKRPLEHWIETCSRYDISRIVSNDIAKRFWTKGRAQGCVSTCTFWTFPDRRSGNNNDGNPTRPSLYAQFS